MKNSEIINPIQRDYLKNLRSNEDKLILEMEDFASERKIPILDWKAAELLEQIVEIKKPDRALEIGTAIGYSSIKIARNLPADGSLDTIEISKHNIPLAKKNIKLAGLQDKINLIEGDALKILPESNSNYDFIFLDSDKEDYETLFNYSLSLLNENGIIFIDNLLWHGYAAAETVPDNYKISAEKIRQFNKLFVECKSLNSKIYPVGDGIGIGIKK